MKLLDIIRFTKCIVYYARQAFKAAYRDAVHYYKNSMTYKLNTEDKYLGTIALRSHVVEKGLTMPNRRYNFGAANLQELIQLCNDYITKGYNVQRTQFKTALSVIFEYKIIHNENNQIVPPTILSGIEALQNQFPNFTIANQLVLQKADVFQSGDFRCIAENRHSIRDFCGAVPMQDVLSAIKLSQTAPSACNRQPLHVHIFDKKTNYKLFKKILDLQKGNRGFGENADKLLVVAADVSSYSGIAERNLMYIDGGIFTMNLLYSLHYYKIASCTLSPTLLPSSFSKEILKTNQIPISIIAIGDCPDSFLVARSTRKTTESIIHLH